MKLVVVFGHVLGLFPNVLFPPEKFVVVFGHVLGVSVFFIDHLDFSHRRVGYSLGVLQTTNAYYYYFGHHSLRILQYRSIGIGINKPKNALCHISFSFDDYD